MKTGAVMAHVHLTSKHRDQEAICQTLQLRLLRPKAAMKKQEQKEAKSSNRLSEAMSERTKRKSGGAQTKNAAFLFGKLC